MWSRTPTSDIACALDDDGILTITLDRPARLNAFTVRMADELVAAFGQANGDDAVRAVIVTGAGRAFCAGMDLQGEPGNDGSNGNVFGLDTSLTPTLRDLEQNLHEPAIERGLRDTGGRVALAIFDCTKPVVAAINGAAIGVGATLTLPMDLRVAADTSRFGFVFGNIGIVPDACSTWFLPRIVGLPKAVQWSLSGELVEAADARDAGLVDRVVPAAQVLAEARTRALAFSRGRSPVSAALTRQMMWRNSAAAHPVDAHRVESLGIWHTSQHDGAEGVSAFREKRAPQFTSRASRLPDFYPWWEPL
jgi:enoyl-CoA hydratase/carnithine racemase